MKYGRRQAALAAIGGLVAAGAVVGVRHSGEHQVLGGPAGASLTARVSAPATLDPDGSVPWVNEPATDADFAPPRTPPPPATGPHCAAGQLRASLPHWIHKSTNGEVFNPDLDASLYGYVVLTNTSGTACTLHGVPTLQLTAAGSPVVLDHVGSNTRGTAVGLPPGGEASFRIDWDAPYCKPTVGPYALAADVPDVGRIAVDLADQSAPGCVRQENHPNLASDLSPGPIVPGSGEPTLPPPSPLVRLTARIENASSSPSPGQAVHFTVVLTNPTGNPISLEGRPGFVMETFCMGTHGRTGINHATSFLLNNRPVHQITAGGSVRFDMVDQLPDTPFPGPQLVITWHLVAVGPGQFPFATLQFAVPS